MVGVFANTGSGLDTQATGIRQCLGIRKGFKADSALVGIRIQCVIVYQIYRLSKLGRRPSTFNPPIVVMYRVVHVRPR